MGWVIEGIYMWEEYRCIYEQQAQESALLWEVERQRRNSMGRLRSSVPDGVLDMLQAAYPWPPDTLDLSITPEEVVKWRPIRRILEWACFIRDGHQRCGICDASYYDSYHFDHKVPLARGGAHHIDNIWLVCGTCNLKKGARCLAS